MRHIYRLCLLVMQCLDWTILDEGTMVVKILLGNSRPRILAHSWKYALEPTGFDPLVDSDGFDPLWCKSPNGPHML
jgi:hypothetical protein